MTFLLLADSNSRLIKRFLSKNLFYDPFYTTACLELFTLLLAELAGLWMEVLVPVGFTLPPVALTQK